jgi:hypothetical protein
MSKLITLLLLNGTLIPVLVALVMLYSYLRSWVLTWQFWAKPELARLRPLIIGLQLIGLLLMVLRSGTDAIIGSWADPWPLGDAFSNYHYEVSFWVTDWIYSIVLGLSAIYAIIERWVRQHWSAISSQRWATIGLTLGIVLAFLMVTTAFSVRVFSK